MISVHISTILISEPGPRLKCSCCQYKFAQNSHIKKYIAKPNMRPLVVAEMGCCYCYWLPAPHYCTFQLTPSLSFLSRCAMMYFVRMMKIAMKMKKQISSSRGGHFRATIFVFRMRVSAVPSLPHSYGHISSDEGHLFFSFKIHNT